MMSVRTALQLGRVSNLPTVWTNVLAGTVLSGVEPSLAVVVSVGVATSLLYIAGMYLNDAFDHRWDAEHRARRPIPMGEVDVRTVFVAGFGMMAAGLVILLVGPGGPRAFLPGLVLAGLVVLYDVSHNKNPIAPVILGLCRVAVYVVAARAVTPTLAPPFYVGAAFLITYLGMLAIIARGEAKNPKTPRLVGRLTAGICIVDGLQILAVGSVWLAGLCAVGFVLTLRLQRRVADT
jgi:4-hydroxybenzoate polyprenyltransferase